MANQVQVPRVTLGVVARDQTGKQVVSCVSFGATVKEDIAAVVSRVSFGVVVDTNVASAIANRTVVSRVSLGVVVNTQLPGGIRAAQIIG